VAKACSDATPGENRNNPAPTEQGERLLRTKFFPPPVRAGQIARPRITDLIDQAPDQAIILVSAPAGYGKTTLVGGWLSQSQFPGAWLSLDEGDNDPVRFLQYLLTALRPIIPAMGDELLDMLRGIRTAQWDSLVTILANALAGSDVPFALVLDDLHVLSARPVLDMLAFLVEHLPPRMRLFLLTRMDPPLALSRLRVRNQLLDIRAEQLRFTDDEVAAFFNQTLGSNLSAEDVAALAARTEGWIAGLQLAALSMKGAGDAHTFVAAFAGSHHYVMDYLVEEVLAHQPAAAGAFLLQTSILERLCGPLCEAVVDALPAESAGGSEMLESLNRMNLFVVPLDDRRRWFRYHHLFADVLRKRLEHESPRAVSGLHLRASGWYEQNGFVSDAIRHALLAGDPDRAVKLLEDNGCFLLINGEGATLLNWLKDLEFRPDAHPWLAIQKAWALALSGDPGRVESTLAVPDRLLAPLEPSVEVRTMQGTIAAARAHCANSRGDTRAAEDIARKALDLLPDCSDIARAIRSVSTSILGDAAWINGNLNEAVRAYTEAIRIGRDADNLSMVVVASVNLADLLMEQGQLRRAADVYAQSLPMTVRPDGQQSPLAAGIHAGLGRLAFARDQLGEADRHIRECIDLSRRWGEIDNQMAAEALLARLEQARGNPGEAEKAIRAAEQLAGEHPLFPRLSVLVGCELARARLAQGDSEQPARLIRERGWSIADEIPYLREPEYLLLARVLLARGESEPALELSERLLRRAEKTGRMGLAIEILVLRALAFQAGKDPEHALDPLTRALAIAQPEGYVRVFLDEGEPMTKLLCRVRARESGAGYAAELLSKIGETPGMTQPSMQLLSEPLTARELEVLKLIAAGHSNEDISRKLVVSLPTVKRHISNIYSKLGVRSRTQAIAIGKELKLFE
jgi:LuxR family maltose regulon positive regulatory protein